MPQYPKNKLAQSILQYCIAYNIENVVISPGSRNAPLTIGFVNHPKINAVSIVDERCAAFFALGVAQQSEKPVVIVCTSGSALLNYYPAIAEAFYSNIPLIILSADRPKHLIDIGDGQTINQENVFHNHILFSANLKESKNPIDNYTIIDKAMQIAIRKQGPVHINIPFDEPLYETVTDLESINIEINDNSKLLNEFPLDIDELQKFADIWKSSSKKMVLVGSNMPSELLQLQLDKIVKDESVIVLTETTSNVYHHKFINSIDKVIFPLSESDLEQLKPEILLTIGGMIVSKKVKQFIRKHQPKHHWHVDRLNARDTFHCLTKHFEVSPQLFFSQFFFLMLNSTQNVQIENYQSEWLQFKNHRKLKHDDYLKDIEHSDLQAFGTIVKTFPNNINLQLANSSIIRYSQLFDWNGKIKINCNRGTSGIEGSTSTAIGASYIQENQTVLITGDISFLYDSNGLWNNNIKNNFRIILINNSGGGIFRFIPGPKSTNVLEFFETPHKLNASQLCKMFEFEYLVAENNKSLKEQLETFYENSSKPRLLEIFTPNDINDSVLKEYFKNL